MGTIIQVTFLALWDMARVLMVTVALVVGFFGVFAIALIVLAALVKYTMGIEFLT